MSDSFYGHLANAVLILHVGIVLFIVTLAGGICNWPWVRNFWFRALHLAGIGYVAMEAWLGIVCPLTTLEHCVPADHPRTMAARTRRAGGLWGRLHCPLAAQIHVL